MKPRRAHQDYDAVVIGAGVNGLVCAALLAKAKLKVLVVEAQGDVGGACATREFAPSYKISGAAHLMNGFEPRLMRRLRLRRHGLALTARSLPTVGLDENGRHLILGRGPKRDSASIANHSPDDAAAYDAFSRSLQRIRKALAPLILTGTLAREDIRWAAATDRRLRGLTRADNILLGTLLQESVSSLAVRSFKTPLLGGVIAALGCFGHGESADSPASGLAFLQRSILELRDGVPAIAHPQGGLGGLAKALTNAATGFGAEIRTGISVKGILVEHGRAAGIVLDSGEHIRAHIVMSSLDPRQTFLSLLPRGVLQTGFLRQVARIRVQGVSAKLHLALKAFPDFRGLSMSDARGRLLIAPSAPHVAQAHEDAHQSGYSQAPIMEITLPSIHDPTLAPGGQHVLSAIVQYTMFEASTAAARDAFLARIFDTLERYAPGLTDLILAGELLLPADLESAFGIAGGCWHQGARPCENLLSLHAEHGGNAFASPIAGLYLCGAAARPGNGVTGLPGSLAAEAVLSQGPAR